MNLTIAHIVVVIVKNAKRMTMVYFEKNKAILHMIFDACRTQFDVNRKRQLHGLSQLARFIKSHLSRFRTCSCWDTTAPGF